MTGSAGGVARATSAAERQLAAEVGGQPLRLGLGGRARAARRGARTARPRRRAAGPCARGARRRPSRRRPAGRARASPAGGRSGRGSRPGRKCSACWVAAITYWSNAGSRRTPSAARAAPAASRGVGREHPHRLAVDLDLLGVLERAQELARRGRGGRPPAAEVLARGRAVGGEVAARDLAQRRVRRRGARSRARARRRGA